MCKKKSLYNYLEANAPIYSIICIQNYVIVSVGGGGKRFGIENRLIVYKRDIPVEILHNKIFELSTNDHIIEKLTYHPKMKLIGASGDQNCIIYSFDSEKGTIVEINKFQTDFKDVDPCQNVVKFNYNGNFLATGGDDTIIRLWDIKYVKSIFEIKKIHEFTQHTAAINDLDFHITEELLISASEDKTCRLYDLKKKILLKKLTFGEGNFDTNLKFFSCNFSFDEKHFFTVQNPFRGSSYLTVWELNENIDPVKTIKLHTDPATACVMSKEGVYLGVGFADGKTEIINLHHVDIEGEGTFHDMVVKGLSFSHDTRYLISGAPDTTYKFLPMGRPEGMFSKITKVIVASLFLIYFIMFINDKIIKIY